MLSWARRFFSGVLPRSRQFREVNFEGEEGFVDLIIPIIEVSDTIDGSVLIRVLGNSPVGPVGFGIEILPKWKRQDVDDGRLVLYWGTVRYLSIGTASDRFLTLLAKQYDLPAINPSMKDIVEFTAVGLHTDPQQLKISRVDMKLFLDLGTENDYAEIFTNIDIKNKIIEVKEKDFDYRIALLSGLLA